MSESGIYLIWCLSERKGYVGSSKDIRRRWRQHLQLLKKGKHPNGKLQEVWSSFGKEAFIFSILELITGPVMLAKRETFWIEELSTFWDGYNLTSEAETLSEWDFERRERQRQRMILLNKTLPWPDERREAFGKRSSKLNRRQNHSPERKLAASLRMQKLRADGTIIPPERSEEQKVLDRARMQRLHATGVLSGGFQNEEHKQNSIALCKSGKLNTPVQRQKAGETLRRWHASRRAP